MNEKLLDILVCPICKSSLIYHRAAQELICRPDKLAYPIRDGVPILRIDQANSLDSVFEIEK